MKVYDINHDSYSFSEDHRYNNSISRIFSERLVDSESWSIKGVSESWFFAEEDIGCKVF